MSTPTLTSPGLVRALGPVAAVAVVAGTVIGSGIFKKSQAIAGEVPYFGVVALVWVLGGVFTLLGALAYAEVAVLLPRAGGNYVFLREGYGRLFGFLWGWVEFLVIRTASLAALATIVVENAFDATKAVRGLAPGEPLIPGVGDAAFVWAQKFIIVAVLFALAGVNILGVRWGGALQTAITAVKVASLLAIVALPFAVAALAPSGVGSHRPDAARLDPWWPDWSTFKWTALGAAFLGVLWPYHGWMNIAPVAEEVKNPSRNLPLALLTGVGIVIVLYLGAAFAYALVITQAEMANPEVVKPTMTVATVFSERLLGPVGAVATSVAVMISAFGALNGNVLVGPRLLYAMGKDGLAPEGLQKVHPRYHTPARAILVLTAWAAVLVLGVAALTEFNVLARKVSHFDVLTDFAMFGAVIFETMAVMAIFTLRWKLPHAERPYRCWGYPVTPALYLVLPAFIIVSMVLDKPLDVATGLGFVAVGVLVYYALGLWRGGPPRGVIAPPAPPPGSSDREPEAADARSGIVVNPTGSLGAGVTKPEAPARAT